MAEFLVFILQNITAANVLIVVANRAGIIMAAGRSLPYSALYAIIVPIYHEEIEAQKRLSSSA